MACCARCGTLIRPHGARPGTTCRTCTDSGWSVDGTGMPFRLADGSRTYGLEGLSP